MSDPELPAELRRYILTSIPSVPYLETVLLLRAEPQKEWYASQLARRLYVPERTGAELLELLRSSGVGAASGTAGLHYAPDAELADLLDRLAQAYATNLVTVTDLIHSRIDRRAQQFADA